MKLVSMCVNFGSFTFEGEEFLQHNGLAMGSPLSAVAACLFMEVQEKDHYSHMVGRRPIWLSGLRPEGPGIETCEVPFQYLWKLALLQALASPWALGLQSCSLRERPINHLCYCDVSVLSQLVISVAVTSPLSANQLSSLL
ncbi:uncharacterized protein LOC143022641 isoform X1 [Oratosquilla oratoria]|uniref:uncharacterized protein LOC143022641 isoform X1 n=1 Tax=Oratosquilla oratoria TaxID=337810 RepID=UPI003F75EB16